MLLAKVCAAQAVRDRSRLCHLNHRAEQLHRVTKVPNATHVHPQKCEQICSGFGRFEKDVHARRQHLGFKIRFGWSYRNLYRSRRRSTYFATRS